MIIYLVTSLGQNDLFYVLFESRIIFLHNPSHPAQVQRALKDSAYL